MREPGNPTGRAVMQVTGAGSSVNFGRLSILKFLINEEVRATEELQR
jgi:hypothetical protein